jgi:alpha-1,2-mannosyltransferase
MPSFPAFMDKRRTALWILLTLVLLLSLARFGYESNRIREGGFVDFPIFWNQAVQFLDTGQVYSGADLAEFRPVAPVFKFPPFYLALLVPLARLDPGESVYLYHWVIQLVLYMLSGVLCVMAVGRSRPVLYSVLLAILVLNYEAFYETLYGLQVETLLLAVLAACLLTVARARDGLAGLLLSVAAWLKVYPAFLGLYFVLRRRWSALTGIAVGGTLILLYSLAIIGIAEHLDYFGRVLPHMLGENPEVIEQNLGLGHYLQLVGLTPGAAKAWTRAIMLFPVALSCMTVYRAHATNERDLDRATEFALFLPLLLLVLPNSWSNYQMLLVPAFAVLLAHVLEGHPRRSALIALGTPAYVLGLFSENTPYLLSVITIPEIVYWPIMYLKILSNVLLWIAFLVLLRHGKA